MVKNKVILTQSGYDELAKELTDLKDNRLPEAIDRLAKAREFGDLSENSEYDSARDDLAWIHGRVEELEDIVNRAKVVKSATSNSSVNIGNIVVVHINGNESEFSIVGEWEADPAAKKISHESPLGKALLGKKVGDQVEVEAPAGKIVYTIKQIK
jgi:transcription elongation factor GreA